MRLLAPDSKGIAEAVRLLANEQVIGFPTDTVYGLAALATSESAMTQIYESKQRPPDRPLVLMVADASGVEGWADVDERAGRFMRRWWPGPVTLVLRATPRVTFPLATGDPATIAARIPDHAIARSLLAAAGQPLATTSANLSGAPPALQASEISLPGVAAVIDGGPAFGGVASTIVDLTRAHPVVLREGAVPGETVLDA